MTQNMFLVLKEMESLIQIGILCFAVIGLITVILGIWKSIWKKKVKKTSERYQDILQLNQAYVFYDIQKRFEFCREVKSKAQFDRFNYERFLEENIENSVDSVRERIEEAQENICMLSEYNKHLRKIASFADKKKAKESKVPYVFYKSIEKKITEKAILHPVTELDCLCKVMYTSPKGKNHYTNAKLYSLSDLVRHYNIVLDRIAMRETKEYQRKKMTDSLRYDIMKRDGFRCVLCGRTAADGVKLHVDHILPVSKGGKTEADNLRTLCDECNLGKRDKYDEEGVN